MNWTGGSLSRSRKQNANLTAIQKKHFARVRGQLLNGRPPPTRLDVSLFKDSSNNRSVPSLATTDFDRPQVRQRNQLTLDDYESVRPVVKQLQSLKPRHARKGTQSQSSGFGHPPLPSGNNLSASSRAEQDNAQSPAYDRDAKARAASSAVVSTETPPPIDELEAKRHELLGTSDWMGLKKMKPLKMKFADEEDRDLIGKRRRVDGERCKAVRVTPVANEYRRPVVNTYEKLNILRPNSNMRSSPSNISIHIGSSISGTPARRRAQTRRGGGNHRRSSISEEMLFDAHEPPRTTNGNHASTQSSLRQSVNASDEMLFDREWSGIASPLGAEPAVTKNDPYRPSARPGVSHTRPDHGPSKAYTISSGTGSEYIDDQLRDFYKTWDAAPENAALPFTGFGAVGDVTKPIHAGAQGNSGRQSQLEGAASSEYDNRIATQSRAYQSSTADRGEQSKGKPFAQATARELASLLSDTYATRDGSPPAQRSKSSDPVAGDLNVQRIDKDNVGDQCINKKHVELNKLPNQQDTSPFPLQHPPSDEQITAPPDTTKSSPQSTSPVPAPQNPVLQPQVEVSQPADATPEDDEEAIWRTFVFGTRDPDEDWIFDKPAREPDPPDPRT
ncbi:MAG: hypothetical protein L6R39_006558, partial [Caloplaca ligustica]